MSAAPMLPPAPALFSTMKVCLSDSVSWSPITRAAISVVPPAAKGTTIRTGFAGQFAWACAGGAGRTAAAMAARIATTPARLGADIAGRGTAFGSVDDDMGVSGGIALRAVGLARAGVLSNVPRPCRPLPAST
jgi:hypothetical protein